MNNQENPIENASIKYVPTSLIAPALILDCITHHFLKWAPAQITTNSIKN